MKTPKSIVLLVIAFVLSLPQSGSAHIVTPLASDAQATHKAVSSGAWSSAATWGGTVPGPDARVLIPLGLSVTVDKEIATILFWVRVDGTLRFATNANTSLIVDSLFVNHGGRLEIGTAVQPVQADKTAKLIISARKGAPIDRTWDPLEFSRGIIAEGPIDVHGAPKTAWTSVSTIPSAGSTTLVLDTGPNGWRVGDVLVMTAPIYDQDEVFSVVATDGSKVTLNRPITYARLVPKPGLSLHVANLTRNVQISSAQGGEPALQGHVMLMGGAHQIRYGGFYDLGRTTIQPVSDPIILSDGTRDPSLAPLCGLVAENIRGRYSLHFHMAGPDSTQSIVEGSAVTVRRGSGMKIGYMNHSSSVVFRQNVSYQIDGSHFMTEEGDETGEFAENLAIHSIGSDSTQDEQPRDSCTKLGYPQLFARRRLDVGHRGHGFWIHSGGVSVIGNVSTAHGSSDFEFWTRPLNFPKKPNTFEVLFPIANLPAGGAWAGSNSAISIEFVPGVWRDNTAYVTSEQKNARKTALSMHYHGLHQAKTFPKAPKNLVSGFTGWNTRNGVLTTYAGWFRLENIHLTAGSYLRPLTIGMGLAAQGGNNMDLMDVHIDGFKETIRLGTSFTCSSVFTDGQSVAC